MYFPYLRGKQSEILAIRELVEKDLIGNQIIPIIEPIQFNATLSKTLEVCLKNNKKIAIIMNSEFISDYNIIDKNIADKLKDNNIIKSYLVNSKLEDEISNNLDYRDLLIINTRKSEKQYFLDLFEENLPLYSLVYSGSRPLMKKINSNKIILDDKFNKQKKNADYSKNVNEFFSDDHLYFKNEDFVGFSDYSIIGEEYTEGGFMPYAIAIHIVYFDEKNELRIMHFVSDSNNDTNNPAGKFKEAVEKLNKWVEQEKNNKNFKFTYALNKFKEYYDRGKFPSLATIKKLSIMHHIELVNNFIENNTDK